MSTFLVYIQSGWKTYKSKNGADHQKMEGVTIRVGDKFQLEANVSTKCPGKSGVARHDCNCRCFIEYDVMTEEEFAKLNKNSNSAVAKPTESGIIKSGAISGALNPDSEEAQEHAKQYYKSVTKMKTDYIKIAENTGFSETEIKEIKDFIFNTKHDLGRGELELFAPSYEMAETWQRLIDGKNIQPHDITMLNHEIMEKKLMRQGMTQDEAHRETSKKYNYGKEAKAYYDKIKENSKK